MPVEIFSYSSPRPVSCSPWCWCWCWCSYVCADSSAGGRAKLPLLLPTSPGLQQNRNITWLGRKAQIYQLVGNTPKNKIIQQKGCCNCFLQFVQLKSSPKRCFTHIFGREPPKRTSLGWSWAETLATMQSLATPREAKLTHHPGEHNTALCRFFSIDFCSRSRILPSHMCFGIRILGPFLLATQIISVQNLNCPKTVVHVALTVYEALAHA